MTIATEPNAPVNTLPLLLDVSTTTLTVTPEQFMSLCRQNPDLRLELTPNQELIVMVPTLPISGKRKSIVNKVYSLLEKVDCINFTKFGAMIVSTSNTSGTVKGGSFRS
jgi:Uma2 family endonuclease